MASSGDQPAHVRRPHQRRRARRGVSDSEDLKGRIRELGEQNREFGAQVEALTTRLQDQAEGFCGLFRDLLEFMAVSLYNVISVFQELSYVSLEDNRRLKEQAAERGEDIFHLQVRLMGSREDNRRMKEELDGDVEGHSRESLEAAKQEDGDNAAPVEFHGPVPEHRCMSREQCGKMRTWNCLVLRQRQCASSWRVSCSFHRPCSTWFGRRFS